MRATRLVVSLMLLVAGTACETSAVSPTGSTSIAVRGYVSPANGESIATGGAVTLTVRNALVTDPSPVTYRFEVALDLAFAQIVVSGDVPETAGGQTSFAAGTLAKARYFWRVRASAGGNTGVFTQPISFTVG